MEEMLMDDDTRFSFFSLKERAEHVATEQTLITRARSGTFGGLLNYWIEKRKVFLERSLVRDPYRK